MRLYEILLELLAKWSCHHEWKGYFRKSLFGKPNDKRPCAIEETLICTKCGKIKKVEL
jgi:hypothetical protein